MPNRKVYQKNPNLYKEKTKEWREQNRERLRTYAREYARKKRKANLEFFRQKGRKQYWKNPQRARQIGREYYQRKGKGKTILRRYGEKAYQFWLKYVIKGCLKCGSHKRLSLHHIDRDNSNNEWINLAILCSKCHGKIGLYFNPQDREILAKWFKEWISEAKIKKIGCES